MKIRQHLIIFMLASALSLVAQAAHAVISCNISSPGFFAVYDSTLALPTDTTSSVTINCSRALADPSSQTYTLSANNGLNSTGQTNQAMLTTFISYNEYQDAGFTKLWGASNQLIFSVPINFGSGTTAAVTIPFYSRIAAGQAVAVGNYTDVVSMTLETGPPKVVMAVASHSVLISTIPQCQISSPPGNIVFTYTSFQPVAAVASTSFATRCSIALPYTMSLDTNTPLLGLTYSLALPITTGTGTALPQTYTISGTIPANQSGTCAAAICTTTAPRTLTITF